MRCFRDTLQRGARQGLQRPPPRRHVAAHEDLLGDEGGVTRQPVEAGVAPPEQVPEPLRQLLGHRACRDRRKLSPAQHLRHAPPRRGSQRPDRFSPDRPRRHGLILAGHKALFEQVVECHGGLRGRHIGGQRDRRHRIEPQRSLRQGGQHPLLRHRQHEGIPARRCGRGALAGGGDRRGHRGDRNPGVGLIGQSCGGAVSLSTPT